MSLTCAGEFVLSFAQVVGKEERNLEDILSDIEQQERGTLKLGAGTMRGAWILSQLLPDFHRRYPLVEVRFSDALSTQLEAMVSNGELDFAVVLSGSYSPDLLEQRHTRAGPTSVPSSHSKRGRLASRTRSKTSSCAPPGGPRSGTSPGCPSP